MVKRLISFMGTGIINFIGTQLLNKHQDRNGNIVSKNDDWTIVNILPVGIFIHENDNITFLNKLAVGLLGGHDEEQFLHTQLLKHFLPDHHPAISSNINGVFKTGQPSKISDVVLIQLDGTQRNVELTTSLYAAEKGQALVTVIHDISSLKNAESHLIAVNETLQKLSLIDELTQLANRRAFNQRLDEEWKRSSRDKTPLSLILVDIDDFKVFNDSYGHQAGDECLRIVGKAMQETLHRPGDVCTRYGGEEFAIILPNTDLSGACHIAGLIRKGIEQLSFPHRHSSVSDCVTISAGVATMPSKGVASPWALIARADAALYEAKHSGKNRIVTAE